MPYTGVHHFANKGPCSRSYGFSSSHVWMWKVDHKESWEMKNWCFQTVVLEKTLESPLDCKIKPVNPKGHQSWIFTGSTDAEAEAPILWPLDVKVQLIGKDPDAGKDWWHEEKLVTEDEMVGWHHWLNGHEFEQTSGDSEGEEAWHTTVHGVTKSWPWLSSWTTTTTTTTGYLQRRYKIEVSRICHLSLLKSQVSVMCGKMKLKAIYLI